MRRSRSSASPAVMPAGRLATSGDMQPARRVLRVAEQGGGQPPLVRRQPGEQPAGDLGGHLLGQARAVVGVHLLEQLADVRSRSPRAAPAGRTGRAARRPPALDLVPGGGTAPRAARGADGRAPRRSRPVGLGQPAVDEVEVAALEQDLHRAPPSVTASGVPVRVGRVTPRQDSRRVPDTTTPGPHGPGASIAG